MQLKVKSVGNTNPSGRGMNGNVFDSNYLCPTLTTNKGEGIKILIKNATKTGYLIADDSVVIGASRGRDSKNPSDRKAGNINLQQRLEINENGTSNTITFVQKDNYAVELPEYRIRKLTPKECWRLMGCSDEDFEKAEQVNSNSQLYKQAGNAIVVDVLEAIFAQLFLKQETNEDLR